MVYLLLKPCVNLISTGNTERLIKHTRVSFYRILGEVKIKIIIESLPENTTLSARQMDILERILDGKSRKEIAVDLHLSENTVKTHTGMLYKALGVSGRDEIYARFQK